MNPYASNRCMISLLVFDNATSAHLQADGNYLLIADGVDGPGYWQMLDSELTELEQRGWLILEAQQPGDSDDEARVRMTDDGKYWLGKWAKKNRKNLTVILQTIPDFGPIQGKP